MLIGLVGKPSVGKSTFFKAATLAEVEIASYPFTTIKANTGVAYVKVQCVDREFGVQCTPREGYCLDGWRFVPVQLMDVAGLIPGAHEGKGLGNQFLDELRQADVLIHVVDIAGATNERGEPVAAGSYDPADDIAFLEEELDLWYVGILIKIWEKFVRLAVQEQTEIKRAIARQFSGLGGVTEELVERILQELGLKQKPLNEWADDDVRRFATGIRRKTKPIILACNKIDVSPAAENFARIRKAHPGRLMVPCSAESEIALREAAKKGLVRYVPGEERFTVISPAGLSGKQQHALDFIAAKILGAYGSTGVQQVLDAAVFQLLRQIAVFPGGVNNLVDSKGRVLPDCFLLPPDATALDFAFRIHTDIGKKFIRAIDVRQKVPIGKDSVLKNRDVVEIKTGA